MRFSTERWYRLSESYKAKYDPAFFNKPLVSQTWDTVDAYFQALRAKDNEQIGRAKVDARKAIAELFRTERSAKGLGLFGYAYQLLSRADDRPPRHMVLIPFQEACCADFTKAVKGETFTDNTGHVHHPDLGLVGWKVEPGDILYSDTPGITAKLAELGADDVLYIKGHCLSGGDFLTSSNTVIDHVNRDKGDRDWFDDITVEALVELLEGGLKKSFAGKIKVYGCNSASPDGDEKSFTLRLANLMKAAGYIACGFYGYTDEIKQGRNRYLAGASDIRKQVFADVLLTKEARESLVQAVKNRAKLEVAVD